MRSVGYSRSEEERNYQRNQVGKIFSAAQGEALLFKVAANKKSRLYMCSGVPAGTSFPIPIHQSCLLYHTAADEANTCFLQDT